MAEGQMKDGPEQKWQVDGGGQAHGWEVGMPAWRIPALGEQGVRVKW